MASFFNDYLNIGKIVKGKREYRRQMRRVDQLPDDYRFVFKKIQSHMWRFAAGSGYDMLHLQYDLIDLFEAGAAEGKPVLKLTGSDVAAFCDDLLRSAATYTENWRDDLNRDIQRKLGQR